MCMWFSPAERKRLKEMQNTTLNSASTSHSASELGETDFQGKNHKWFYLMPSLPSFVSHLYKLDHFRRASEGNY